MDTVTRQMMLHGKSFYDCARYEEALDYFLLILEHDRYHHEWEARCYVAKTYYALGKTSAARHELIYIAEKCPIDAIRRKAFALLKDVIYSEASMAPVRMSIPGRPGPISQQHAS